MNLSGKPVSSIWTKYKQKHDNPALVIVHDELQIPLGKIQVRRQNTSARGHNGLRSIDLVMGNKYVKIAVGIGRPETKDEASNYVLSKFTPEQFDTLMTITMPKVLKALNEMANGKHVFEAKQ